MSVVLRGGEKRAVLASGESCIHRRATTRRRIARALELSNEHCARAQAALLVVALAVACVGKAQTTLVTEGFEGIFPGSWSTGDPTQPTVYWKDVNNFVGTVSAHTGGWKGYCAGIGYSGPATNPAYANNMTAFMSRSINSAGFSGANLTFWLNIPSIEPCCDRFRVYMDATLLYEAGAAT